MLTRYVIADLTRNPRRSLATMVGVVLGVGLFCSVLFFIDGLSASMTQRAVAPLPIDMQRIIGDRTGAELELTQTFAAEGSTAAGARSVVRITVRNLGDVNANEVTIRSLLVGDLRYVAGSAYVDDVPLPGNNKNPLASGPGSIGLNIGTVEPGGELTIRFLVDDQKVTSVDDSTVKTSYSSRESVRPIAANRAPSLSVQDLVQQIAEIEGVASVHALSFADLSPGALSTNGTKIDGPTRVFGFDAAYADADASIELAQGRFEERGAVVSVEAAQVLGLGIGDVVTVSLPDGSSVDFAITGLAELSRARSLFSSRRGGDFETFAYTPSSIVVSQAGFRRVVAPAYERAAAERGERLKNPPVQEVDLTLDREVLDADPALALFETEDIASQVEAIAQSQDFLLDNISNTLTVAKADSRVAKRLFIFLGVPGGILAAMLSGYAGAVLAEGQRREQATLRIRGAGRRHLIRMLVLRTVLLAGCGSILGLGLGYFATVLVLGQDSLSRASTASLATSALVGSIGGLLTTGLALYLTGRRSIFREISQDIAGLPNRPPLWRRTRLDLGAGTIVLVGTVIARQSGSFNGIAGSVYYGQAVELSLTLLVLPIGIWIAGSLAFSRLVGRVLIRSTPSSKDVIKSPLFCLYRRSVGRRPWAIGNGIVMVALIVALASSLSAFASSYDQAKVVDARFSNGADVRLTPRPTSNRSFGFDDAVGMRTSKTSEATSVLYGEGNVILRSARTSDPASLAAIDPTGFQMVAPLSDDHFPATVAESFNRLANARHGVLLSEEMAGFLQVDLGHPLYVLLGRGTEEQVDVEMEVIGIFERLPGFPEGVDAVTTIDEYLQHVPAAAPDFFLLSVAERGERGEVTLEAVIDELQRGVAPSSQLWMETRATTLARDQSSLAALNIAGLVELDSGFALAMALAAMSIFVFGLLLQRRREYVTLRAQGLGPRSIGLLIGLEAATVAVVGVAVGTVVGAAMGYYFVAVLRPLFVLAPAYVFPATAIAMPVAFVAIAAASASTLASVLVARLEPIELLRDE